MKFLAVVFAALLACVAGANVNEQRINERFVEGIVAGAVEDLSNQIRELGLDPYYMSESVYWRLAVTDIIVLRAEIIELLIKGLSNIVLHRVNYGIITSRLTFEISLPLITTDVVASEVDLTLLGYRASASLSGSLAIRDIRVSGDARISIGIISGISIRSLAIDFRLAGVTSELNVNVLGKDISEKVNQFAGVTVPSVLEANRNDINRVLEHYLKIIIESNL